MSRPNTPLNFAILDHLPQGVFILRPDGTISFWNHCLEEWTGILKSTIIGNSLKTHFPHLCTPQYTSHFEPLFKGGSPATFASQVHPQFLPCSLPNGTPRIQQTIARALWEERTQEWQALVIIQDISDLHRQVIESQRLRKRAQAEIGKRKEAETVLREKEIRLELAISGTQDGIWDWMDVNKDEEWWSPHFYELLGFVPDEFPASVSSFQALLHPDDLERTKATFTNHFEQHLPFDLEYRLRTKSGIYRWFRGTGMALRDEAGLPTRMAGSIRDITESREQEKERRVLSDRLILAMISTGMGIWDWTISTNQVVWSDEVASLLGFSTNILEGTYNTYLRLIHPEDRSMVLNALRQAFATHMLYDIEHRIIGPTGQIRWIACKGQLFTDQDGKAYRMTGTFQDITPRKQAEHQLQENQLFLSSVIENIPDMIFVKDANDLRFVRFNKAGERLLGLPRESLIGKTDYDLFPSQQADFFTRKDRDVLAGLRQIDIPEEIIHTQCQGTRYLHTKKIPILDEQGRPQFLLGISEDITKRKNEELERDQRELLLHLVIETGPSCIKRVNADGILLHMNPAGLALIEAENESDALGLCVFDLVTPEHRMNFEQMHHDVIQGKIRTLQFEIQGLKGTRRWMETFANPFLNPITKDMEHLAVTLDITERKNSENAIKQANATLEQQNQELAKTRDQALRAARSKSEFLATMSHEIRTPLNGVIGMTDLLLSTGLDADQQEMVETVKHSGEFLLTLINDILDFSKIDAGKLDLEIIDFDIRTAVDEVLDILAERAGQKNLELIGLIYGTTPLQLRGDPGRIRQILFNLIGNAIKFTQEGEIVVDVSVVETLRDATTLRFAVTDTGIGITPDAQQKLFEIFTQADSSTTRKFGGTGLGLAICKQLVTLMHGEIGVISEEGYGSTFWFTIPLAHKTPSSPTTIPRITLRDRRVCIVETHDTIRFLLQHYVESWGMVCEVARDGEEGLALLHERANQGKPFDIALLDHRLTETVQENGFSLAAHIRRTPKIAQTPLILLTALGKRGEGKVAEAAGFNGYLTKPVRHAQLQQCLQMVLDAQPSSTATHRPGQTGIVTRHSVEEAQARAQTQILLAEDNVVNQKVAVRMLQKLGYQVDIVGNGLDAIEALARTSYDLILMDCQMPEMDGLEATKKIREAERAKLKEKAEKENVGNNEPRETTPPSNISRFPSPSRMPIIALTANALPEDREDCFKAGMDDFLPKPVRLKELSTMISKWLPRQSPSKESDRPMPANTRQDSTARPPCLDKTTLNNLKALGGDDDPEFFLTVIDQFLSDLPRHLKSIQQSIERQDAEALIKAAHACKGSSRSIGATWLAEISYALELMGREGTMEATTVKFEEWLEVHKRTIHTLQQNREQQTAEIKSEG